MNESWENVFNLEGKKQLLLISICKNEKIWFKASYLEEKVVHYIKKKQNW